MADFNTLLSKPLDDVEKPKPLPVGTYEGRITKYEVKESREKKTPMVEVSAVVTAPDASIDPTELANFTFPQTREMRRMYFLTPDAEYRLKELINSCGISTAGRTFSETLPELVNQPVVLDITQRPSTDGTEFFNDINNMKGST